MFPILIKYGVYDVSFYVVLNFLQYVKLRYTMFTMCFYVSGYTQSIIAIDRQYM